jgi:DUF1009 family protein
MTRAAPTVILPDPPGPPGPLGLIAAGGRLPILVAEGMRRRGHEVLGLGLKGQYDPALPGLCDGFEETPVLRLGSWGKSLARRGAHHAVMVGKIDKAPLMHSWGAIWQNRPDMASLMAWLKARHDRRSHVILAYIADQLAKDGVFLIDSTAHIPEHLATPGAMTSRQPTGGQRRDIDLGWPILQEMLRLDIGQGIAVREGDVLAVEAVEGTDAMIERAGLLCRGQPWTLLKSARAGHDRRSDVPTVGPQTIETLHAAGGRCIALGAGDVIIVDKPDTLALADKLGVAVWGMEPI